jgi:hypothetical protein
MSVRHDNSGFEHSTDRKNSPIGYKIDMSILFIVKEIIHKYDLLDFIFFYFLYNYVLFLLFIQLRSFF